ncbi:hypothetical protein AVEN_84472-1 [Araneus ventricosus]|uniref:Uncharacterized protein n=1 Tax=Araneus ventricosus TaxID=182803 RepID=A0A4Y2KCY9_ARAVE|nr:hypothetical protein AVEN_84472-1 [Araneus ventricosus]
MSRFEATLGIFRDRLRNSDDEEDTRAGTTLSKLPHHISRRMFDHYVWFDMHQGHMHGDLQWIGFLTKNPPTPTPYHKATVTLK